MKKEIKEEKDDKKKKVKILKNWSWFLEIKFNYQTFLSSFNFFSPTIHGLNINNLKFTCLYPPISFILASNITSNRIYNSTIML